MRILKKISVATAVSLPKSFFKELKTETPIMRLFGLVRGYEIGNSQYGAFFKFKGEFHAIDLDTGEESVSSVAFLPSPVDELLSQQVDTIKESGDKNAAVEFGFDISVTPDENSTVGFQYRINNLGETRLSDPMQAVAERMRAVALPAPKKTPIERVAEEMVDKAPDAMKSDASIEEVKETKASKKK